MRIAVLAVASLIAGAVVGGLVGRQEFAHEVLPIQNQLSSPNGSASAEKETGPRLTILTEERYDFGEMDRDSTMTHTFEIRNDGTVPLTVTEQGTSCKCTTAGLDKDQLSRKSCDQMEWNAKNAVEPFEQYAEYPRTITGDPGSGWCLAAFSIRSASSREKHLQPVSLGPRGPHSKSTDAHPRNGDCQPHVHQSQDCAIFPPGPGPDLKVAQRPGFNAEWS
jgi:hypothetical protein